MTIPALYHMYACVDMEGPLCSNGHIGWLGGETFQNLLHLHLGNLADAFIQSALE